MKSEGGFVLFFILFVLGLGIIGVSEDYSRNTRLKTDQERKVTEQITRNQEKIGQFRAEQAIYALGCATLDCAIEKSMKR